MWIEGYDGFQECFTCLQDIIQENIALLKIQESFLIDGEFPAFEQSISKQDVLENRMKIAEDDRISFTQQLCESLGIPLDSTIIVIAEKLGEEAGTELMMKVARMVEAMQELTLLRMNVERMINFQLNYIEFLQAGITGNEKMHTYNPVGKARAVQRKDHFQGNG